MERIAMSQQERDWLDWLKHVGQFVDAKRFVQHGSQRGDGMVSDHCCPN